MVNLVKKSGVSLAGRLILTLNAVVVVVTMLAGGWFYFDAAHKARARLETKAQQLGIYLKGALNLPLWEIDDQAVIMIGKTLMEDRELNAVTIQDSEGYVIYTHNSQQGPIALTHEVPIQHGSNVVGNVKISFSEDQLRIQTEKLLWVNVTIVAALLVAISLSAIFLINRLFKRPIEELTTVAESFGQGLHEDSRNPSESYREFLPLLTVLAEMEERVNSKISQLTLSEERFRQVAMTNWVWETDLHGCYTYCSENVEDTMGYTAKEMIGKTLFDFMRAEEASRVSTLFNEIVANKKQIVDLENWNITKDGAEICLLTNGGPFFDEEGNLVGYRGGDKDITDRKLAESELTKYREHLEHLVEDRTNQLKETQDELIQGERLATLGRLTATVSHELRNPLATIQTALFSIEDSLEHNNYSQVLRPLELAERSISRCVNIIEELNSYARVKGLDLAEAAVDDWLREVVMEQSIPTGISCSLNLNCGVKSLFDQEKLRQVVVNLIANSIHALQEKNADRKELQISTQLIDSDVYEIRLSDNGIGMSDDIKEKVFEPLFSTKGFGVGLGMVVVKNIVEQHHGEIVVESQKGEGTTISLRLPIRIRE